MTMYLHGLRLFANAYNPGKLGGDGRPWAATDHPIASLSSDGRAYVADPEAGTYSNLINLELGTKALDDARVMASKFITPEGLPFDGQYGLLLVSPDLEPMASKLLGRESKLKPLKDPESAENAANSNYDLNWMVVGAGKDGLKGKQWALCDPEMMQETTLLVVTTEPEVQETELDNPLIQRFVAYADFAYGFGDGRPIIFSNPA